LLSEPFTLPQLQQVYETVLGRSVDKSGFRTRMLAANFLVEAGHVEGVSNRPAMGYRLADRSGPVVFREPSAHAAIEQAITRRCAETGAC
jgi:hypothetical protein